MRASYLDTARGAGIILVVYGHVLRGLVSAGLVPAGLSDFLAATDYTIYTFHMPLFFLLSGLHVPKSLQRASGGEFLSSKLRTIVYPYLVWSVLQGGVQIALSSHGMNHPFTLHDLLAIGWRPFGQFWFLYALFICMLVAWAVAAVVPGLGARGGAVSGGVRALLVALAIGSLALAPFAQPDIAAKTLTYLPFFIFGMLIGDKLPALLARTSNLPAIGVVAAAFCAAVVFAHRFGDSTSVWAVPAGLAGTALVLMLVYRASLRGGRAHSGQSRPSWLERIGFASMPIYLAHILATAGARIVLVKLGITNVGVHLALGTLAGVVAPMVLYALALRSGTARFIGFPPLPRTQAAATAQSRIRNADAA
ncbi:acyltransferase [Burkholderia singularis]|uniref:Acyltransferase n=1 Tax=Burkholderia singularis TaxID=1503053 RepID=A0A103E1S0_9BURK|nr:acyltransferase [Burkholderia singularis]KVE26560.1 acyltransferase [Burkholderia singularis]